jgi:hypothetical protein
VMSKGKNKGDSGSKRNRSKLLLRMDLEDTVSAESQSSSKTQGVG